VKKILNLLALTAMFYGIHEAAGQCPTCSGGGLPSPPPVVYSAPPATWAAVVPFYPAWSPPRPVVFEASEYRRRPLLEVNRFTSLSVPVRESICTCGCLRGSR
jgi:hypothetical protein